ncbi:MAG: hypothetical protein PVF73_07690 [Bacteroidales bacterium]|jgi:hypothetical protein
MNDVKSFYKNKLIRLEEEEQTRKRRLKILAFTRLLLFIAVALSVFILIPRSFTAGIGMAVLCTILFLTGIKVYVKQNEKYKQVKALISVNKDEVKALDHDYSGFDPGVEFIDQEHPYSYDMDLFGEGSVFQYLNRTVTVRGRKYLSRFLSEADTEVNGISERQLAVRELSGSPDLLQEFRASGMLLSDESPDIQLLNKWIKRPYPFTSGKGMAFMAKTIPAATILSIIIAVLFPALKIIPVVLVLFNFIFIGTKVSQSSKEHGLIGKRLNALKKYGTLLSIVENGNFSSGRLIQLGRILVSEPESAAGSILQLSKIVSAFDHRLNFVAAIFLEGLFLWDIQCMIRLERWRRHKGQHFDEWIERLAEFDALSSLAMFAFNHPGYAYPGFTEKGILKAGQIGHFLIPSDQRVYNDFEINKRGEFIIVTGANMAGKSTFLRTIATNVVMAMAGAPVCADRMVLRPMPVFSSMRTSDSLNKNESYFYAELKRLKEMLNRLKKGEDLFLVLDEILKGTNSADKQKGSRTVLKRMLFYEGTGIIATHDLELANLEKEYPGKIRNLCFEIGIDKASISFDYKLREGVTTKMNASLLMRQMGIIEE